MRGSEREQESRQVDKEAKDRMAAEKKLSDKKKMCRECTESRP